MVQIKAVRCITDVILDDSRVFTVGKIYTLTVEKPLEVRDDKGVRHRIGKDFKDKWFTEHFVLTKNVTNEKIKRGDK